MFTRVVTFLLFISIVSGATLRAFTYPSISAYVNGTVSVDTVTGATSLLRSFPSNISGAPCAYESDRGVQCLWILGIDNTTLDFYFGSYPIERIATITANDTLFLAGSDSYVTSLGSEQFIGMMVDENDDNTSNNSYFVSMNVELSMPFVPTSFMYNIYVPSGYSFNPINSVGFSVNNVTNTVVVQIVDLNYPETIPYPLAIYNISNGNLISITPTVFNQTGNLYAHGYFVYLNAITSMYKYDLLTNGYVSTVAYYCSPSTYTTYDNCAWSPTQAFCFTNCGGNHQVITIELSNMTISSSVNISGYTKLTGPRI